MLSPQQSSPDRHSAGPPSSELRDLAPEPIGHPTSVAVGPEEDRAVVTVDAGNLKALACEEEANLGTDEAARSRHQQGFLGHMPL